MAIYPPPSETPPVFNELDFIQIISTKFLDNNYLRLLAQSDEDMNQNQIRNMASGIDGTPTEASNAATIADAQGHVGLYLPLNGDTGMVDVFPFPTTAITSSIEDLGAGTGQLNLDCQNVSFGACVCLTNNTAAVAVSTLVLTNFRRSSNYRLRIRNNSTFTITFVGNSTAPWTGTKNGTSADLVVTNGRECEIFIKTWDTLQVTINFNSIR